MTAVHDKIDNRAVFKQVVTTLEALPYRIQPIAKKNNVTFYNDSYSSTPTATMAAIAVRSFTHQPLVFHPVRAACINPKLLLAEVFIL